MSDFQELFKTKTRWANILGMQNAYRLLCSDPNCSLSCANLKNGKISVTSTHGDQRHSYVLSKKDMAFAMCMFLNSLTEKEVHAVCDSFNKISDTLVLELHQIE